ncbi:hypothetical protein E2986_12842 [Frieseomelitta varia]|uniref:Uncharacterized protein n=1 Tax=Frieseomelitta varia TaxID=561572 RepID=A0A833S2S0_9HYME|nr:hypothetical protein E2986_12842 [Frieseomelitta varia]
MDKKTYKKYKRRITKTKALVDNKPPKFKVSVYYKPHTMKSEKNRILQLDKENMKLLRRMNIITRLEASITNFGTVDCWLPKIKYKSRMDNQEVGNKQLMKENKRLLRKICRTSSDYPTVEFIQSWKNLKMKIQSKYRQIIIL